MGAIIILNAFAIEINFIAENITPPFILFIERKSSKRPFVFSTYGLPFIVIEIL